MYSITITGLPVVIKADLTAEGLHLGCLEYTTRQHAATCGQSYDFPEVTLLSPNIFFISTRSFLVDYNFT